MAVKNPRQVLMVMIKFLVSKCNGNSNCLVIPGVLLREEVKKMRVEFIGNGHIGARVRETSEGRQNINRI